MSTFLILFFVMNPTFLVILLLLHFHNAYYDNATRYRHHHTACIMSLCCPTVSFKVFPSPNPFANSKEIQPSSFSMSISQMEWIIFWCIAPSWNHQTILIITELSQSVWNSAISTSILQHFIKNEQIKNRNEYFGFSLPLSPVYQSVAVLSPWKPNLCLTPELVERENWSEISHHNTKTNE